MRRSCRRTRAWRPPADCDSDSLTCCLYISAGLPHSENTISSSGLRVRAVVSRSISVESPSASGSPWYPSAITRPQRVLLGNPQRLARRFVVVTGHLVRRHAQFRGLQRQIGTRRAQIVQRIRIRRRPWRSRPAQCPKSAPEPWAPRPCSPRPASRQSSRASPSPSAPPQIAMAARFRLKPPSGLLQTPCEALPGSLRARKTTARSNDHGLPATRPPPGVPFSACALHWLSNSWAFYSSETPSESRCFLHFDSPIDREDSSVRQILVTTICCFESRTSCPLVPLFLCSLPYGYIRLSMRGKGIVSRTWSSAHTHDTTRSMPMPKPACGTLP